MEDPVCVKDFEAYANKFAPKMFRDFWNSGANGQQTAEENQLAFKRIKLRPRVLQNVSQINISTQLLGHSVSCPIGISPSSLHMLAHQHGEKATAKAASSVGLCYVLSSGSSVAMEDIESCAPNSLKWFQMYILRDRTLTKSLIERAEQSGFKALVITIDVPVLGVRLDDRRNRLTIPEDKSYAHFKPIGTSVSQGSDSQIAKYVNSNFDSSLTWKELDWIASITSLPVVLKGIVTSGDALEAIKYSCVKGIWVSNHGGRQLDGIASTIAVLPEIVQAVNGQVEIYLDGGVREGTDILKAIALGAKAVFVGRPVLWGLVYDGEEGVKKMLNMLKEEFLTAMALSGCSSLASVGPQLIFRDSVNRMSKL